MEGAFPHRVFPRRAVLVACAFVAAGALTAPAISSSSALPAANGLVVANTSRGFVLLNASDDSLVARVPGTGPRDTRRPSLQADAGSRSPRSARATRRS